MLSRRHARSTNPSTPAAISTTSGAFEALLLAICALVLASATGCFGGDDEEASTQETAAAQAEKPPATTPAPAPAGSADAEPEAPTFDPALLVGSWSTTIEDPENDLRMDLVVTYDDERFHINGAVSGGDDKVNQAYRSFEVRGTWTIEADRLLETADSSTFPLWRTGVKSTAYIKQLDDEQLVFERSGAMMTYTRDST